MRLRKISIIGVGLLGGSIGLAVKARRLADEVAGYVRRDASLRECEKARAVDYATTDLLAAVSGADLVVLCSPLAQMPSLARQLIPALKRGAIVTDVGSVKASVVRDLETMIHKAGAHFVGGHPMAGGEKAGVLAARRDLFDGAVCILTPSKKSRPTAVRSLERFWKSLGARVLPMTPELHDTLVSRSSHLPHVTAAAMAAFVLNPAHPSQQATLCATGFRDTTRIASGSPEMWRDIALANRKNLARELGAFVGELRKFQRALQKSDAGGITKFFETAKQRRDDWCACCASPSPE